MCSSLLMGLHPRITSSQPSRKKKKKKIIIALAKDSIVGHMLVEIAEPQNLGKLHELSKEDFWIRTIDLGNPVHDSIVKMWKSTNEKIKDKLEELRVEKEILKASNKELVDYINYVLRRTSSSQFDPNTRTYS